ncbi:MAG: DNA-directed polymerase subunit omega [Fimbriimonadaceae bacterium]|jgi:DNA-directed RNA polymerase subunit omega|nr:DNA-directed polymerase subunit omega [Fimbriimonadaceae bacterium]
MLPSPDILNEFEFGKFVLSNLAAKRAKQLKEGAPPLVRIDSNHPLTIALAEIAAGKIKPIMPEHQPDLATGHLPILVGETRPAEFGVLLPALDETEVAMVSTVALGEEEHEAEPEGDEALSLSDLVGEEEEEAAATPAEEETLSLSDIAEEETTLEEEETEE